MKPWSEKYKPKSLGDMITSPAFAKLKKTIEERGVALVYGPTGTGKTNSVEVIAREGDYELIEMNASDFRDAESVNKVIGGSLGQKSLFEKDKIILVDEVNGIAGNEDRGGVQALVKLLTDNTYPIVLTAEDPWTSKLNSVRKKAELIEFYPFDYLAIVIILEKICKAEKIKYDENDLRVIARRVGGDLRAAINDLQIHACTGKVELTEDADANEREKQSNIMDAMTIVLKSSKWENVQGVYDTISEDYKEVILWLDQNIPYEYSGEELVSAYDALSRADIFSRRIMRWQHWRYLVYIYQLLSSGVALAKHENKKGQVVYKRSSRPLRIWMSNQRNAKGKVISEKLAAKTHTSKKGFFKEDLPYLKLMARHNKLPELKLDEEEIEWLKK